MLTSVADALQYRTVAARGAMLFFLLNSLNKIHAFYQYSLNAFVTVFSRAIDVAPGKHKRPHMAFWSCYPEALVLQAVCSIPVSIQIERACLCVDYRSMHHNVMILLHAKLAGFV